MEPRAFLFDLDGTLIDSDPLHAEVYKDIFRARGHEIDEAFYLAEVHGRQNVQVFGTYFPDEDPFQMHLAKEAAFRDILPGRGRPIPGAVEAVRAARTRGLKLAVVTNAPRLNADASLGAIGLTGAFDAVIVGEECTAGKPDPAPYLAALDTLGVSAADAIAFEDSPAGIRSAVAAGIPTIGIRSSLDDAALRAAGATRSLQDFNDNAARDIFAPGRKGAA